MAFPIRGGLLGLLLLGGSAGAALAGPPFLTDDPQPTDPGHWEIYNFINGGNDRAGLNGETGIDLNYGAAKDLQLTAVLPLGYDDADGFSARGLRAGTGVIELAVKYQVLHAGSQTWFPDLSIFPRVFVPTDHRYGAGHVGLLLPIWAEKDFGPWQVFGGGGYQINPGADQRNFWQGGIAVNRTVSKRLQLGVGVRPNPRRSGWAGLHDGRLRRDDEAGEALVAPRLRRPDLGARRRPWAGILPGAQGGLLTRSLGHATSAPN